MSLVQLRSRGILDGTISAGDLATGVGGKVLQVVSSAFSSQFSTTSTSLVTTGHTLSITPSSASNKILIFLNGGYVYNNNDSNVSYGFTIYRNSTNLAGSTNCLEGFYCNAFYSSPHSMSYYDSPSTTSSTTYTIYMKVQSGTKFYNFISDTAAVENAQVILTAIEIAG